MRECQFRSVIRASWHNGGSQTTECSCASGKCGYHRAPMGVIPLCTCSYMAYLLDRTFTAPQGADCWVMGPMMHISPLLLRSCTQLPITLHPVPTRPPPPSPGQKDYFSSSSSWGRAAAAALPWRLYVICSPARPCKRNPGYTSCVGAAQTLFNLYNKKYIAFLCSATQKRGQCVFSSEVWDCQCDGSLICSWLDGSVPVSIHVHLNLWAEYVVYWMSLI